MTLDAVRPADDQDAVVLNPQGPLHLRREIHMARRVQKCGPDGLLLFAARRFPRLFQDKLRLAGKDRNSPGPLQLVAVHMGIPMVYPPGPADAPALVEHGLRQGRLPGVYVSDDAQRHPAGEVFLFMFQRCLCHLHASFRLFVFAASILPYCLYLSPFDKFTYQRPRSGLLYTKDFCHFFCSILSF